MEKNKDQTSKCNPDQLAPVRDLVDFHLRWREFRPHALAAADAKDLSESETDTVHWLIKLADRIGLDDIGSETKSVI